LLPVCGHVQHYINRGKSGDLTVDSAAMLFGAIGHKSFHVKPSNSVIDNFEMCYDICMVKKNNYVCLVWNEQDECWTEQSVPTSFVLFYY